MKYLGSLFFLSLFFLSCGTKGDDKKNGGIANKSISLEKLDSVRIDYLGDLYVHDLDPVSQTVLFEDRGPYSQVIVLADFDGNIINSFSKFGDMPDTYGKIMAPFKLLDFNSFLVYGYNGFMTYDFGGNLLSRVKLVDFEVPSRPRNRMGYGLGKLGSRYLYIDQSHPPNGDYSDIGIYGEMYLLNWLDPETGEKEPFIQFPESSIFRNGKYFFRSAWDPVYELADGLIYVAFGLEPVIYAYEDSPPYSLVSSLPLELPEYRHFKGANSFNQDLEYFRHRFTSAFIENIKKVDGYFLVAYFPGYDNADTEMRFSNQTPEEIVVFNERMREKYPYRIAILDSLGSLVNDFVPGRLDPRSMLVQNGQLWMQELSDEEVERDYFRLFRVGLRFD